VKPDLTYDALNPAGRDVYPITAPTWLLVYKNQPDTAKRDAITAFLDFIYGEGQKIAASVDYAPLPTNLLEKAKAQVRQLS
jgi:phosphate transport system substrate-binding protein